MLHELAYETGYLSSDLSLCFTWHKGALHRSLHAGPRSRPAKYLGRLFGNLPPSQIEGDAEGGKSQRQQTSTAWVQLDGDSRLLQMFQWKINQFRVRLRWSQIISEKATRASPTTVQACYLPYFKSPLGASLSEMHIGRDWILVMKVMQLLHLNKMLSVISKQSISALRSERKQEIVSQVCKANVGVPLMLTKGFF